MAIKTINISQITVGMVLAEPILNMNGQMLLSAGATLQDNHMRLFKTWGIQSVAINSVEEEATQIGVLTNLSLEEKVELRRRINWMPINEHEKDIYNLAELMISKQSEKF